MMPPSCRVVRGGQIGSIPAQELVKGDIVFIKSGDKVPADLILFAATDIKVDNSSVNITLVHVLSASTSGPLLQRANMYASPPADG